MVEPKALRKLPQPVRARVARLVADLRERGPYLPHWPHFSQIRGHKARVPSTERRYHCHIHGFRWVACWRVRPGAQIPEIYYVGSHEGAPY